MKDDYFKKIFFLIILSALILRLSFLSLTPPFEVADGIVHFSYISFIAEENRLPVMKGPGTEYYQAPLYYLIQGFLLKLGKKFTQEFPLTILRMADIIFGMLTIYFAYKIGSLLFKNRYVILGIVTFVALLPTYAYFNAHNVNINLEVLFSTIGIYILLLALKKENYKLFVLAGIIIGLGVLTRASIILLAMSSVFLVFLKYFNNKKFDYIRFARAIIIIVIFSLLVSGWWLVRNFILYGDFVGSNAYKLATEKSSYDWDSNLVVRYLGRIFATFWASFGISNHIFISYDEIRPLELGLSSARGIISFALIYGTLFIITLLSLLGIFLLIRKYFKNKTFFTDFQIKSFLFMGIYPMLILASHIRVSLHDYQPQGKFYFIAIVPLAIFFILGIYNILSKFFNKKKVITILIILFVVLNILSLIKLISVQSYISYLDKKYKDIKEVKVDKIEILGKASFSPFKISVNPGTFVTFINKYNTNELFWLNNTKPEYRIIILKGNNKYLTSTNIQHGEKFYYKFDKKGLYKIRSGHYGEVQAEILVE